MQGFARVLCSYYECNDPQGAAVAVQGTDDELVAHCLDGRREAFSELVLRHQKMVYSVARGMLGDAHLAEDLAQEAFLHAYRALSSRSEEHTSELQSRQYLVCRLLLEKKKKNIKICER